jgi:hypothetical protein
MLLFLHLNNSLGNKWFDFKIPFQSVCTIIPFPTCFPIEYLIQTHCVQILSCSSLGAGTWLTMWLVFLTFQLSSPIFSIVFQTWFGLPHPSIASFLQCICTHHINLVGIHFLHSNIHGNEHKRIQDVICDTFVAIVWNVDFHVGWKQLHALPSTTFNFFGWWVDIVFTKDDIRTVVDIVIVDSTWAYLLARSCAIQGFVALDLTQIKERKYYNQHPIDQFLSLAIEIFGHLHKQVDVFLHDCANAIWSLKGLEGLHLFILVTFLCQKLLIVLQRMQAS